MCHVVVMDDSEAQFSLTHYSQALWEELREELPSEVEFERCGTIWVAVDEEEMSEISPDPKDDPFCLCSEEGNADFIVTLNPKDFPQERLRAKVISPEAMA